MWGSKTAGRTIRKEDLPPIPRQATTGAFALATTGALALAGATALTRGRRIGLLGLGPAAATGLTRRAVNRAARDIFGGNATVLDDIGRQTARFVCAAHDPDAHERFLTQLRPGPAIDHGQDLLRGAYRHYFDASHEPDPDRRDELMLCANLLAILHEHQRLEPYLDASIPNPLRRFVTERLLGFSVGAEAMKVSSDVPGTGPKPFPETLQTIEDPELKLLLDGPHGWDRTPDATEGSAAHDWTKLSDRMNFIVDLFRTRQKDPNLFTPPYSATQADQIRAGRIPPGPL